MAAIEVAQTLGEHGITTRHALQVGIWQNEEGGLYGSRAVSGQLTSEELQNVSRSGKTIADGIAFLGGDVQRLATARCAKGDIAGYLELHIEQGGTLERDHIDIGVVEGIVGIKQWEVTVTGFANHAGTTPMDQRHDALLAAARFVDAVNRVVTSVPGRQVGTVGRIQALPGAPNVIPGQVICTLELRDLDAAKVDSLYATISAEATKIGSQNGTTFSFRLLHENVPAPSDPRVRALIADSARELGLTSRVMPSGAGHDAQAMATLAPMGMIFVPSIAGISHAPKEFSKPADITNGANVLLETLLRVDEANWS
jgi:N-carbamoyl-L-amino-acid hydrolase